MDVALAGANVGAAATATGMQDYIENYYLPQCPGGIKMQGCKKIVYKDIYPNIDWVLYTNSGGLKYDFIVHPGGNVADIKLRYEGATSLALKEGALLATTPLGSLTEQAPISYDAFTKTPIPSAYKLEGNTLSFKVQDASNSANSLVIDPSLKWATYYGGNSGSSGADIASDSAGNVYLAGTTPSTSNIATSGTYHQFIAGTGDGFLVKIDTLGVLILEVQRMNNSLLYAWMQQAIFTQQAKPKVHRALPVQGPINLLMVALLLMATTGCWPNSITAEAWYGPHIMVAIAVTI